MNCPIIRPLKIQGGTLYSFSSVNRDINQTLSESTKYKFKFSKFVALNIPNLYNTEIVDDKNGIYLQSMGDQPSGEWGKTELNNQFKKYIQNYILNLETLKLNENDYNNTHSFAECIFFKWLSEIGGIEFEQIDDEHYKEKEKDGKVINYIGDIDIANSVDINGESYSEIYLHIPSNHGRLDYDSIILKQYEDLKVNKPIEGEDEWICGRTGIQDCLAIYDDPEQNTYTIKEEQSIGIDFDNIDNDELANKSDNSFEFNTVLIYYDLIDQNNNEKVTTNLYGVLFLEEVSDASTTNTSDIAGYIQRYPKYVETDYLNGNSFGLKVNIKIDVNPESLLNVETVVSENATHSMELFSDAMTELQRSTSLFMSVEKEMLNLNKKAEDISNVVAQMPDWDKMKEQIISLNNLFSQLDERVKKIEEKIENII